MMLFLLRGCSLLLTISFIPGVNIIANDFYQFPVFYFISQPGFFRTMDQAQIFTINYKLMN